MLHRSEYFTGNMQRLQRWQDQLPRDGIVDDFTGFVRLLKDRPTRELLLRIIGRLTEPKLRPSTVKPGTMTRDGRWTWENIQAGMGKMVPKDRPLDKLFIYALGTLIVHDYAPQQLWGLKKNWWNNRLTFELFRDSNSPHRLALDILKLLLELLPTLPR